MLVVLWEHAERGSRWHMLESVLWQHAEGDARWGHAGCSVEAYRKKKFLVEEAYACCLN